METRRKVRGGRQREDRRQVPQKNKGGAREMQWRNERRQWTRYKTHSRRVEEGEQASEWVAGREREFQEPDLLRVSGVQSMADALACWCSPLWVQTHIFLIQHEPISPLINHVTRLEQREVERVLVEACTLNSARCSRLFICHCTLTRPPVVESLYITPGLHQNQLERSRMNIELLKDLQRYASGFCFVFNVHMYMCIYKYIFTHTHTQVWIYMCAYMFNRVDTIIRLNNCTSNQHIKI